MSSIIPHPAKSRNQNDKVIAGIGYRHTLSDVEQVLCCMTNRQVYRNVSSRCGNHPRATEGRKRNSPVAGIGEIGCSGSSGGSRGRRGRGFLATIRCHHGCVGVDAAVAKAGVPSSPGSSALAVIRSMISVAVSVLSMPATSPIRPVT